MNHHNPGWSSKIASYVLVVILCAPTLYVLSFAPTLGCFIWWPRTETEAVLRIYRPLFLAAPNVMAEYSQLCGFTDLEAFVLTQSMMYQGGRIHEFHINIK